jgi:hypothetical protein
MPMPPSAFEALSVPIPPGFERQCERPFEATGGTDRYELWATSAPRKDVEAALIASLGAAPWTRAWPGVYDCVPTDETRTLVQASVTHPPVYAPDPPPAAVEVPTVAVKPPRPKARVPDGQYPGLVAACDGRMYGTKGEHAAWEVFSTPDAPDKVAAYYGLSLGADGVVEGTGVETFAGWELHLVAPRESP